MLVQFLGALVVLVGIAVFMVAGAAIQFKKNWPFK